MRFTGAPTATVSWLASALTAGAMLVYSSSTPRPNCVRAFDVMVLTSISHSGCSQPYARWVLPCRVTSQISSASRGKSAGTRTSNWYRLVRG